MDMIWKICVMDYKQQIQGVYNLFSIKFSKM